MQISGMNGGVARELEATVDTGAAYTTLPARLLRELGIEPTGQRRFLLADAGGSTWMSAAPGSRSTVPAR